MSGPKPAAAESAARFASIHTRASLLPLAFEMRRTGEAGELFEFLKYDIEFHATLLKNCGNELFASLSGLVAVVLEGRTGQGLMPLQPKPEALDGECQVVLFEKSEVVNTGDGVVNDRTVAEPDYI